jgi:hypothetical protein
VAILPAFAPGWLTPAAFTLYPVLCRDALRASLHNTEMYILYEKCAQRIFHKEYTFLARLRRASAWSEGQKSMKTRIDERNVL